MNKFESQQLVNKYNLNLIGNLFTPSRTPPVYRLRSTVPKHNLVLSNLSNLKLNLFVEDDPQAAKAFNAISRSHRSEAFTSHSPRYDGIPVLWGNSRLIHWCWEEGIEFLHLDAPYVDSYETPTDRFRLSINATQRFHTSERPGDRLFNLQQTTQREFKPWRNQTKAPVLVCPPSNDTARIYSIDVNDWLDATLDRIKEVGLTYKIRFKPPHGENLLEDLSSCSLLTAFNSNIAVDALFHGVPVVVSELSAAASLSGKFKDALRTHVLDRSEWAQHIAYSQWTVEELRSGEALRLTMEDYPEYVGFRVNPN